MRTAALLALYLLAAAAILGSTTLLVSRHEGDALALLSAYLLPPGWRATGEWLARHLLRSQAQAVLVNACASGALVVVSVLLFPLKEAVSARFEVEGRLTTRPTCEPPLWVQATQELKLVLLYVTAQLVIVRLGIGLEAWRKPAATALSFGFLFFSFAIDFISPLLQRHGLRYSQILKTLARRPLACLAFGAAFSAPQIACGQLLAAHPEWSFAWASALLFGATLVAMAAAVLAGTWVASRLLEDALAAPIPGRVARTVGWPITLSVLAWHLYVLGAIGLAIHHKSQLLKCHYRTAWSSVRLEAPTLTDPTVGARLTVEIENPTPFDVQLEQNRIEIVKDGQRVATTRLDPVRVPAGARTEQVVRAHLALHPGAMRLGWGLVGLEGWTITLWLEVAPGVEVPVSLLGPR